MPLDDLVEQTAKNALAKGQQHEALTCLMRAYGDEIFRFCVSQLASRSDAQDVLQTVFVQAYQGLEKFEGKSAFRTWLFAIARHRCLDHIKIARRRQARVEFVDEVPEPPPDIDATPTDPQLTRALRRCLDALPESVRTVVLLRFQAGFSYAELAQQSKEKAGTLQARVVRALPTLRRCLEAGGVTL